MNPKSQWCNCGYTFQPSVYQKVIMLIKGKYIYTCPKCHSKLKFVLIHHVVKVDASSIKNPEKIWRRG